MTIQNLVTLEHAFVSSLFILCGERAGSLRMPNIFLVFLWFTEHLCLSVHLFDACKTQTNVGVLLSSF